MHTPARNLCGRMFLEVGRDSQACAPGALFSKHCTYVQSCSTVVDRCWEEGVGPEEKKQARHV